VYYVRQGPETCVAERSTHDRLDSILVMTYVDARKEPPFSACTQNPNAPRAARRSSAYLFSEALADTGAFLLHALGKPVGAARAPISVPYVIVSFIRWRRRRSRQKSEGALGAFTSHGSALRGG